MDNKLLVSVFELLFSTVESLKDGQITLQEAQGLFADALLVAAIAKHKTTSKEELEAVSKELFESIDAIVKVIEIFK